MARARRGVDPDGTRSRRFAREHPVTFDADGRVEIDGHDVSAEIRAAEIDRRSRRGQPGCPGGHARAPARARQRGDAVIEGRDIGTVVAPGAEVKVFLVAAEDERARRRTADRPGTDADTLAGDLRRRDERDAVNMQAAADAVVLDTTALSVEDVVARIAELVEAER